ncbi:MAG TPA: NAD-dependent epimerase/dehydratase family protein [Thermoanaerobaculia bacterium]
MRIFLTGATGYIGSAVAAALRRANHDVAALVRPDADSSHLRSQGIVVVAGDLDSLPSLGETLDGCDGFIHTAAAKKNKEELDRHAVDVFTAQQKPFVYTSGVWILGNTRDADEAADVNPLSLVTWRAPHEERVVAAGGAVLRPGCVYGGKQSLLADWFLAAQRNEPVEIVGDGTNRWALVDLRELADCYVRALEQRATGVLHAIDDSDLSLAEMAQLIGVQPKYVPLEEARASLGPYADALAVDQKIGSRATREKLGWNPRKTFASTIETQWAEYRAATS